MPITSPDNIFFPDVSSPAAEVTNLSTMAASIQTALGFRTRFDFVWTNLAGRTAQTGMVDGSRGYQIDTGFDYKYNGTVWRNTSTGLVPIMPTTVSGTGASLGVGGQVNLSGASSAQINGVFTAEFDNYRIDCNLPDSTAALTVTLQMSSAGSPDTTATNYDNTSLSGIGTTASSGQAIATANWNIGETTATSRIMDISLEMKRPFLLKPTQVIAFASGTTNPMTTTAGAGMRMLQHRPSTSYDGLTFTFTGAPTGVIHIYGWNNGAK